jgi:hypothetical protein
VSIPTPKTTQPPIQWIVTTHLQLMSRSRMSGAIGPLPHVSSWCAKRQLYLL